MVFTKGKKVATWTGAAGILALLGAAFASRGWLLEEWHLHKLGSKNARAVKAAAEWLYEMRSKKAIPRLIQIVKGRRDTEPEELSWALRPLAKVGGVEAVSALISDDDENFRCWAMKGKRGAGRSSV
jgi:hypothetical protein